MLEDAFPLGGVEVDAANVQAVEGKAAFFRDFHGDAAGGGAGGLQGCDHGEELLVGWGGGGFGQVGKDGHGIDSSRGRNCPVVVVDPGTVRSICSRVKSQKCDRTGRPWRSGWHKSCLRVLEREDVTF